MHRYALATDVIEAWHWICLLWYEMWYGMLNGVNESIITLLKSVYPVGFLDLNPIGADCFAKGGSSNGILFDELNSNVVLIACNPNIDVTSLDN